MNFYSKIIAVSASQSNGTFDLTTGQSVHLENGYQVTFQERDAQEYSEKFYNFLTDALHGYTKSKVYLGVFDQQKELSFFVRDKAVALEIAREFNQHSIFDWDVLDIIENANYKK